MTTENPDRELLDAALTSALIGAGAIVLEHLAATEISRGLHIPREWDKRFGQALGTSTIYACYAAIARSGASRGQQLGALAVIIGGCGCAAIGCSAVRWALDIYGQGKQDSGRTAQWARDAREDDDLDTWRRALGGDRRH